MFGRMEEDMKVTIKMIRKMVTVYIYGLMEENTKENGKMANNMEKVNIY